MPYNDIFLDIITAKDTKMGEQMQKGFEIGFFKRKIEVNEEQIITANKEMEKLFLSKEKALVRHMIIKIEENLYADVTIANTKNDAQKICEKWTKNKHALSFLDLIEVVKFEGLEMLTFADIINE